LMQVKATPTNDATSSAGDETTRAGMVAPIGGGRRSAPL
jgi:hypothetical protein